ncbi:hypothetical protein UK99_14910 [Frankia casuarinae]|uniref:enoyl-CoA hydratase-related protein n=1 Tax=Frankia TaxID=1854 RepID=UPI0004DCBAA1|nr:enoyl-CoA hydratase-related protein [Frankia sp. CeD]KEZ36511.1 enoyl-CoA hydratase/isomerase family protein [Frankia sp. CeD]ORT94865.1 hypothetical protein UK99_14910 [Frankia casuarinae]
MSIREAVIVNTASTAAFARQIGQTAYSASKGGLPEVTLGVIPGAGGTQRLVHAAGKATAMRMLLTGEPIIAADALAARLAAEVVPDTGTLATATKIAERITDNFTGH